MNTRRSFLKNSSLVTAAAIAFKPLHTFAGSFSSAKITGSSSANTIILLYTNNSSASDFAATAGSTSALKTKAGNIILLNAADLISGNVAKANTGGYDAVLAGKKDLQAVNDTTPFVLSNYNTAQPAVHAVRTITKGSIKIGIIGTAGFENNPAASDHDIVQEINNLAKKLKEENCNAVVCISSLGFKTQHTIDDTRLAKRSSNIDVIISANNAKHISPEVLLSNEGQEVLIDNAGGKKTGIGRLEIGFDSDGKKNYIAFGEQALTGMFHLLQLINL